MWVQSWKIKPMVSVNKDITIIFAMHNLKT